MPSLGQIAFHGFGLAAVGLVLYFQASSGAMPFWLFLVVLLAACALAIAATARSVRRAQSKRN